MKKTIADYPELVKEWHPTLNGDLMPCNVSFGSHKKVWWQCEKNHEWQITCYHRTGKSMNGCPYCSNYKVCKENCLATLFPEIAKEWHPTKNGKLTPSDVIAGTNKKVWWLCKKNHEWKAVCNDRTYGKKCCACCNNKKVCKDNCLATTHPELAKEWHSTKNGKLTPNDVIAGTHKKFWWLCKKNHEWKAVCKNRTGSNKTNCPVCSESKGEKEVVRILDKLNISYQREFRFDNCKDIRTLPFDFKLNINNKEKIIEYHGEQHYKPRCFGSKAVCKHERFKGVQHRDKIKKDFCESRGIPFLEISYVDYDKIEELITKFIET
jgi:hypothetical protein